MIEKNCVFAFPYLRNTKIKKIRVQFSVDYFFAVGRNSLHFTWISFLDFSNNHYLLSTKGIFSSALGKVYGISINLNFQSRLAFYSEGISFHFFSRAPALRYLESSVTLTWGNYIIFLQIDPQTKISRIVFCKWRIIRFFYVYLQTTTFPLICKIKFLKCKENGANVCLELQCLHYNWSLKEKIFLKWKYASKIYPLKL